MDHFEETLAHINRMHNLLKQHERVFSKAVQGEICDAYKESLELEIDKLEEIKTNLLRYVQM